MSAPEITFLCPRCRQRLRVPSGHGRIRVRCVCGHEFLWGPTPPGLALWGARYLNRTTVVGALAIGFTALLLVARWSRVDHLPEGGDVNAFRQEDSSAQRWISISYAGLIDTNEITQSGETVAEVKRRLPGDAAAYAQVQPFVEPYGHLLPDALEMLNGPTEPPSREIDDAYPIGEARPAWVDLVRGGRYIVTYDGFNLARVFAPGRDAREAYDSAVGVLRHPLGMLQASTKGPLLVEVYAYENDYISFELRVLMNRYTFTATSFGPPHGKKGLDLKALDSFLVSGNELTGARLEPDDGLVLVGSAGPGMTLAGHRASVGDFAVAYRAVFHAGYNSAFVSLDPSPAPQRVRVNFGGSLEDTRIGSVVLQSDMRFKTLMSGFDPVSYADVRKATRARVSHFMTVSERDLMNVATDKKTWEGTRFWFYPDAVEILTDLDGRTAYVEKARFAADAERSRDDFGTPEQFDTFKNTRLSPSIRANIDDLNERYEYYAVAFPELQELTGVARLMGICSWLRNAPTSDLDLDGLLAAELPSWQTPRDKSQLLTVSVLTYAGRGAPPAEVVTANARLRRIDPLLDASVDRVFATEKSLSAFLAATGNEGNAHFIGAAANNHRCIDYIGTQEHLKAFADLVARGIMDAAPEPLEQLSQDLRARSARVEEMGRRLGELQELMARDPDTHNYYLAEHNALVDEYNAELHKHNTLAEWASQLDAEVRAVTTIEGGIDLSPTKFKVTQRAEAPELGRVRAAVAEPRGSEWKRSPKPSGLLDAPDASLPWRWITDGKTERTELGMAAGTDAAGNRFQTSGGTVGGGWKERIAFSNGRTIERVYDVAKNELRVAKYDHGKALTYLVAQRDASGRIVFSRRDPSSLIPVHSIPPQN